jgi:hypothetical protein
MGIHRPLEPTVMTMAVTTRPSEAPGVPVGERVELARYEAAAGQVRILYGQRVDSVVRVIDVPGDDRTGRAYLVERGLEQDGYAALLALVEDYLRQAEELGVPPMATTFLY